jgi:hypothetical protein
MRLSKVFIFILGVVFLTFLLFVLEPYSIPSVDTILAVSTFLFGIFIAFSISDRHNRLDKIRENDSSERANIVSLYYISFIFGKKFAEKLKAVLDEYLQATLDYTIFDYHRTEPCFRKAFGFFRDVPLKSRKQELKYSYIMEMFNNISIGRSRTIGLIEDRISLFEWAINLILAVTIISSLFLLDISNDLLLILVTLISFAVVILIYFLYELDSLKWKEEKRIIEPYQKVFESLGLQRYYPEPLIKKKRVRMHKRKDYRVAIYPEKYPSMKGKKVKLVKKS